MTVLKQQDVLKKGRVFSEILIQWSNQSVEDTTWKDAIAFKSMFPEFNLDDKEHSKVGEIVVK